MALSAALAAQEPTIGDTSAATDTLPNLQASLLAIERNLAAFEAAYPDQPDSALAAASAAWQETRGQNAGYLLPTTQLALGRSLLLCGDIPQAVQRLNEALAGYTALDDLSGETAAHLALGEAALIQADTTLAIQHYRTALEYSRRLGDNHSLVAAGKPLLGLFQALDKFTDTLALLPELQQAAHATGDRELAARLQLDLARLQWRGSNLKGALETAGRAVDYARELDNLDCMQQAYALLAELEEANAQPVDALKHHRLAAELDRTILQRDYIRRLVVRDSLLRQKDDNIADLEELMSGLHLRLEKLEEESNDVRQAGEELQTTRKAEQHLKASVRWLVVLLVLVVIIAAVGWWRYTRPLL